MNLNTRWKDLQGEVKKQWGRLTDDDLKQIEGDKDRLVAAIQERYGMAKDEAVDKVSSFIESMREAFDPKTSSATT